MLLPGNDTSGIKHPLYIFTLFFVSVIGLAATFFVGYSINESNKIHLIDRANTLAKIITPSDIKLLKGSDADLQNPEYNHIKQVLTSIRQVNSDIRFIYINGIKDGSIFFYVDSENPSSEDYSPPGEEYPEATPLMYSIFSQGTTGYEGASDHWGYWISAYAPIIDPDSGTTLALIGLDIPGKEYVINIIVFSLLPFLLTILSLSIIIFTQRNRIKERKLIDEKAEFLSIASHEIRTPLTGIRWASENILSHKSASLQADTRNIISIIHDNCVTLIDRLNNLLTITSFESGKKIEFNVESLSLFVIIQEIMASLSLSADARNVKLIIDPSLNEAIMINFDGEQVRHIFSNLITNAIKYTNPHTEVIVSYNKGSKYHEISIKDHGDGITKEDQKHIFDGYHRTETAKHSSQYGTGLGLYLTKKIVTLHGGEIVVNSKEKEGSTFTVNLPLLSQQ